jgi:hypothetical protein
MRFIARARLTQRQYCRNQFSVPLLAPETMEVGDGFAEVRADPADRLGEWPIVATTSLARKLRPTTVLLGPINVDAPDKSRLRRNFAVGADLLVFS